MPTSNKRPMPWLSEILESGKSELGHVILTALIILGLWVVHLITGLFVADLLVRRAIQVLEELGAVGQVVFLTYNIIVRNWNTRERWKVLILAFSPA